jgi:hypothetical protein
MGCPPSFVCRGGPPFVHHGWSPFVCHGGALFVRRGGPPCSLCVVPHRSFVVLFVRHGGPPFVHHGLYTLIHSLVAVPSFVHCSPPHSSCMLFVRRGGPHLFVVGCPPFVHLSWSPSFVVGGPSFVRCSWSPSGDVMAVSTCNPPCEQWLMGLGMGAGSFHRYGSAWGCCCC